LKILGAALLCFSLGSSLSNASLTIMPLGDSITEGTAGAVGSYRTDLVPALLKLRSDVVFVGTKEQGPPELTQKHHEGHSGWRIDELVNGRVWKQSFEQGISLWLPPLQPRVILLMIGTNDFTQDFDLGNAVQRYRKLLEEIWRLSPESYIFVSSVIPTNNRDLNEKIRAFNINLKGLADDLLRQNRPLAWVDMYGEAEMDWTLGDFIDGVHPTVQGYSKMAKVWLRHLVPFLTFGKAPSKNLHR
jgi:acyl-CoA thioesterase I